MVAAWALEWDRASCGSGDGQAPCVQLDLSIDPRSQEAFFATLSQLTGQE